MPKIRPGGERGPGKFFRSSVRGHTTFPSLTSVTPNFDRVSGGAALTITGARFVSGATVTIGGVACTSVVIVDSTQITCNSPVNQLEGIYDLVVTNPNGESATLALAFTYIAGHVTLVTPTKGLTSGGTIVYLTGVNFVTGSTITIGGVAATNVVFVDSQHMYFTTPIHPDGAVDIVITEPLGATVTARNAFFYTSSIFGGDIRRQPSITIHSTLNNGVNTVNFILNGVSVPPIPGEKIIFTDSDNLIFSGQVQAVNQIIEGDRRNVAWQVTGTDHLFRFNSKRPFGVYNNQSATLVVKDLVARYAPGTSVAFVQSRLPRISAVFDGSLDLVTCLKQIATSIGEGHFYLDYTPALHFYILDSVFSLPPASPLELGPGSSMIVYNSSTSTLGYNFPRGYYYFMTNFEYGDTASYPAQVVATPHSNAGNYVLLSDQAGARNLLGDISNGSYNGNTMVMNPYGWIGFRSNGDYIPNDSNQWNFQAGDNYFASADVAARLEAAALQKLQTTALSPISNLIFLQDYLPRFTAIPLGPTLDGRPCTRRKIYAIRLADIHEGGGTSIYGYATINDNSTTDATPAPAPFTYVPVNLSVNPPYGPSVAPSAREDTGSPVDPTEYLGRNAQAGWWSFKYTNVFRDGTESRSSPVSGPIYMTGNDQVELTFLPGDTVAGVDVVFQRFYGSVHATTDAGGAPLVPTFEVDTTSVIAVTTDNVTRRIVTPFGADLSGGQHSPHNVPPGEEDLPGPDLEDTDAPDDLDDLNMDLLLDPPITSESDGSQIRNRVYVKGRGTIMAADAAVGDTTIFITDSSTFSPTGGTAILGARILTYVSLVKGANAAGFDAMLLGAPLSAPILQADWKFGGGTPIRPFVQVDDLIAQQKLGAIETDSDGNPTDGVREYTIEDDSLTTVEQMVAKAKAELKLFASPIVTVRYTTSDPKTRPGKVVHIDLTDPPLNGDFVIQEVTINHYHDESDEVGPFYSATADSAARFNFNDMLQYLFDKKGGGGATASKVVSIGASDDIVDSIRSPTTKENWFVVNWNSTAGSINYTGCIAQAQPQGVLTFQRDSAAIGAWRGGWQRTTQGGANFGGGVVIEPSPTTGWAYWEWEPYMEWRIRTGSVLDPTAIYWLGFDFDHTLPLNNYLYNGRHIAILSYLGGGWGFSTGDGGQQLFGGAFAGIAPNNVYKMYVKWISDNLAQVGVQNETAGGPMLTADVPVNNLVSSAVVTHKGIKGVVLMTMPNVSAPAGVYMDIASVYGKRN